MYVYYSVVAEGAWIAQSGIESRYGRDSQHFS